MEYIEKIKKMLCKELDEYAMKSKLSMSDIDVIHKLTDTVKNLDKIEMLEDDGGYSEERMDRRYSRDDAKDHMMSKLGAMMEDADPNEREILKDCMRKLERA